MKEAPRNQITWQQRLGRLQGDPIQYDLQPYDSALAAIESLEKSIRDLSEEQIQQHGRALRGRALAGDSLADLRCEVFALVREASRRVLGLRPFDVQVVAALALSEGSVIEMQTGEGKTLTAVMPAALNALAGRGAHVLTFNDYLARRDAEWMGPVYRMLGLSVGYVQHGMTTDMRRAAYQADVTYVTAKEAGFDHLRDLLAFDLSEVVHRPFHFALVDEADSLMIDEARVPLVIAASSAVPAAAPLSRIATLVASLVPGTHFDTDEYGRDVELTEAGIEHVERLLGCGSLHAEGNLQLLTEVNCALHAHTLLRRDVDYIVRDGRVEIVDEFTGRVVTDRHWPDGLQTALEAKEGLQRRDEGCIVGSMTVQRFLRGYSRLCGMTGTARDCAAELRQLYGLEVVVIPTHRAAIRMDRDDVVFARRESKERAIVAEIQKVHATRRPVLVGTLTVEESERLAGKLRDAGVACQILNAKNDAAEAKIVAHAGALDAITISTNMAGRGTDIRLGGEDERDRVRVAALGGLYVIGTNRHESRRVDLQLRGRAGRQGDPGESRFFLSLEDDLLVRYGIGELTPSGFIAAESDEPIDNPIIRRELARAQRIIEGQNFEIRRTLSRYTEILEEQHRSVMERRQALLHGEEVPHIWQRDSERRSGLVAAAGEPAVRRAEVLVTLFHIDRAWRDYLALCADLREGIHLVRLGGQDPLTRFTGEITRAFVAVEESIEQSVLAALDNVRITGDSLDLGAVGMKRPASTWTYLVNDDPFKNQMGRMLTSAGGATIAIYSAAILMPLLVAWGLVERFLLRRPARRTDPFGTSGSRKQE